ncbi:MAG: tRNA (adenosine(37)-N6)-dimethylallyltransferase MiaA, partial [Proteobacteria bacterium]|nr:tRNA (adenosine(37)-N6)-dimethylallyltransferase MiaA [Pseudomonadota bacterium]
RSLVDGLIEGNARDEGIREKISREIKDSGIRSVYDRLMEIDPEYAENISSNDEVRIVRALEVYALTGKTLTESFSDQKSIPLLNTFFIGLMMNRNVLVNRIEERVEHMVKNGLIEEVAKLIELGYAEKLKKLPTIGYSEVIEHLEGRINESTMLSEIKKHSRQYAKHQMTWFRSESRIHWIDIEEISDPASRIIEKWNNRTQ